MKLNASKVVLIIVAVFSLIMLYTDKWRNENWKHTINSDGKGYYAYLPAIFIYQDFSYQWATEYEKKYYDNYNQGAYYATEIDGHRVNKYFSGVALFMAPFFLLAMLLSSIFGFDVDGYSLFFQTGIGICALFYHLAGLWLLRKTLRTYHIPEWACAVVILALSLGTNLYYYTLVEPSMSHVYSFFAFSWFIWLSRKCMLNYSGKGVLKMAAVFGLILLIRPSNGLILLSLPFLSDGLENFVNFLKSAFKEWKYLLGAIAVIGGILFIQPIMYKISAGKFFIWSYVGESFNFSKPEMMNLLFSYRKGLFVYTPVLIVSLLGLIPLFRKNWFRPSAFLLFFFVNTWVISSWWCWWYGGSFGMRPYIEYFPLFGILLGHLLMSAQILLRALIVPMVSFCIYLCLVQSYQAYRLILPWDGMDKIKYWRIFLKTEDKYQNMLMPPDGGPPIPANADSTYHFNDMEGKTEWLDMRTLTEEEAFSGKSSSKLGGDINKCVTFTRTLHECFSDSANEVIVKVKFKAMMRNLDSDAYLVFHIEGDTESPLWHGYPLFHQVMETDEWCKFERTIRLPRRVNPSYRIHIYVLKPDTDKEVTFIDDMEITFKYK